MGQPVVRFEEPSRGPRASAAPRMMGRETIMGQGRARQFRDPEGHLVGVIKSA